MSNLTELKSADKVLFKAYNWLKSQAGITEKCLIEKQNWTNERAFNSNFKYKHLLKGRATQSFTIGENGLFNSQGELIATTTTGDVSIQWVKPGTLLPPDTFCTDSEVQEAAYERKKANMHNNKAVKDASFTKMGTYDARDFVKLHPNEALQAFEKSFQR